jgi:DNA polymerase
MHININIISKLMPKNGTIDLIKEKVINCNKCSLYKTRNNPVFGEGFLDSNIIFVGEAPGRNEDISGKPFVGRAGKILDEMLESIGLKRKNVYISNIVKCRPPRNRNPSKKEISICGNFIDEQIKIINPKIIVPLGRIAISYFFDKYDLKFEKINIIHGKIYSINSIKIIPIYHPAAVIYNNKLRDTLKQDFQIVKDNI